MSPNSVATRIMIMSDTHEKLFDGAELPEVDVLIHCGDMTNCCGMSALRKQVRMMGTIRAELKLVIAGNHDMDLDRNWVKCEEDLEDHKTALETMTGEEAQKAKITYLDEGTHNFQLSNGAKFVVFASPYTPKFGEGFGFPYERDEDRFNNPDDTDYPTSIPENPVPSFPNVDIMITHGPPHTILDRCPGGNVGCANLLKAVKRAKPLLHCFGHIHEARGVRVVRWNDEEGSMERGKVVQEQEISGVDLEHGKETMMVNASIMNENRSKPRNAPFIVTLNLPSAL